MPGGWAGSARREQLPHNWQSEIRPRILRRDEYRCTWVDNGARCIEQATDVDHIGDRHDHRDQNLASLCGWHHLRKSSAEGNAARRARPRPSERHETEAHPGLA